MKKKAIIVFLYILLALVACAVGIHWLFLFAFDNITVHYYNGILRYVFALIILAGIILPVIKYRKYEKKWVLPTVLIITMLVVPIFNNGIIRCAENSLKVFSKEKWENNKYLRTYMIKDLEKNHVIRGRNAEYVKKLLGEPDFLDDSHFTYYVSEEFLDFEGYCINFKDGVAIDTEVINF